MRIAISVVALGIGLLLGGCSADSDMAAAPEAAETVFDPMVQTLDRAREAEDKVAGHAAELRARIDGLETDD